MKNAVKHTKQWGGRVSNKQGQMFSKKTAARLPPVWCILPHLHGDAELVYMLQN